MMNSWNKNLIIHSKEMRKLAEHLSPFNGEDDHFSPLEALKERNIYVNGYKVNCYLSIFYYELGDFYVDTLEIIPYYNMILPFDLVIRIAKTFLGVKYLTYFNLRKFKPNYVWSLKRNNKKEPVLFVDEGVYSETFNGFTYNVINS